MILLKIDGGKGFYMKNGTLASIEDIEPDDLVSLIEAVAKSEEMVGLDELNNDDRQILNPVEKVIYEEVYKVLNDLSAHRDSYLAECWDKLAELEKAYGLDELPSS